MKTPRQSKPKTLEINIGFRTAWMSGTRIKMLLDRLHCPKMWDWQRRLWMCPGQYAQDVIALAELRNYVVYVIETDLSYDPPRPTAQALPGRQASLGYEEAS